jgi:two-component system sensor histidine kinase VicK
MLLDEDAGKINKDQEDYLHEIYNGNKRMVDLVNSLLNVSRIDLGTFAIEPSNNDVIEICNSVIKEMQSAIDDKKIKLIKDYEKDLPLINVDPKLMRIIFQNLLSNAVKYTPNEGEVSVKINKDTENLHIKIKDSGYGIPKSQQSKIYTKLFRADNVREKVTDGTGLGLYLVKSIVDKSGGKIWFESIEDKGTTFYVNIPLKGMKAKEGTKGLS